jgi:hypothetical protein
LRAEPSLRGAAVVGLMDRLVDAVDSLDYILRDRLPARIGARPAAVAREAWSYSTP